MTKPKITSYSIVKSQKTSSKVRGKTRMPTLPTSIQHSLGSPSHSIQTRKRIKSIKIGRKEGKLPLFADNMVLYIENSKVSTKKLLEQINEFSKVSGYKSNIQKYVVFLYINNKSEEGESKKISHLNLTKENKMPRNIFNQGGERLIF